MKKKIIGIVMIAAIALGAGWNMMQSEYEISLSDLALSNMEALASDEELGYGQCYYYGCNISFTTDCHVYGSGGLVKIGVCRNHRG